MLNITIAILGWSSLLGISMFILCSVVYPYAVHIVGLVGYMWILLIRTNRYGLGGRLNYLYRILVWFLKNLFTFHFFGGCTEWLGYTYENFVFKKSYRKW